jgi:UDP-N-acetylmuramoyl-tripeptide--D-alanyl-D-alanine ligase
VTGLLVLFTILGFAVFAARRLLTYLHLFQQEEYDNQRFLRWLGENRGWDRRLSLALLAIFAAQLILLALVPGQVFVGMAGLA